MFLMTSMLAGLLAVGIPVAIHLMHRQRTTPVKWGAMQFLVETPIQLKRRKRVDHWLLLLLRMAAVALLVFALARPLLVEGVYNPVSGGPATDIAVVLDRSLSTGRASGDRSAYDRGADAISELVRNLKPADTLSVVLAEHRPQPHSIRLSPARAGDVAHKLKALGPGRSDARIPEAVLAAREIVAEGRNSRKMVVVMSDEQRAGWSTDSAAAWELAVGPRAGAAAVSVYSLPIVPDGKKSDLAVADVTLAPGVLGVGRPMEVTATVSNSGPDRVTGAGVRLFIDGNPVDTRPLPDLPPGESQSVRFEHTFTAAGSHWLKLQAGVAGSLPGSRPDALADALPDALPADDEAVASVNVWQRLAVLVIDGQLTRAGDFRSSQFLLAAMQPTDTENAARALVQPKVVSVTGCLDEKLDDYAVVVVNDAPALPRALLDTLVDYARSGHGVWIVLGPRTDPTLISRGFAEAGLFAAGAVERREAGASPPAVEMKDAAHPTVRLLAAAERNTLAGAVTRGWWAVRPQSGDTRTILAASTGDPLVLERPVGNAGGRVVVWCTGVDTVWNNWPLQPQFVPLVNETLYHLAAGQTRGLENRRLSAGQDIAWSGPADPVVKRATLTRPDGSTIELSPRLANGRQTIAYNDTFVPGLYSLRFDQTAFPQPVYYGVGIDPRELDPTVLTAADQKWLADRDFIAKRLAGPVELASAVGAPNKGRDVWPVLAGLLLAALLSESVMTWRVARHQAAA